MADKTLPNNVRELREAPLMSKAVLARKAGLSPLTIDRVESGKPCRMDTKRKIILALGLKLSERHRVFPDDGEDGKAARSKAARGGKDATDAKGRHGDTAHKGTEEAARSAGSPARAPATDAARATPDDGGSATKEEPQVGSDLPKARYS
jgi:DNA-binding XRE family transcriptional regulator